MDLRRWFAWAEVVYKLHDPKRIEVVDPEVVDPMDRTILVVDDMDEAREMCAQYLTHEGFRVAVASNGQEAVEKTSQILPTLVLMDLSLPVMGGLEATKRIKSDPRTQHIPVILLTAQVRSGSAAVIEGGCEGFLVKPAAPRDIVAEIERVLKRARIGT
jgi:two-component system cell cycle response regulator DivK